MKYEDLKDKQTRLVNEIDQAARNNNNNEKIRLKRLLYLNKIDMIDAIDQEDKDRLFLTGLELHHEVENMPNVPRYATGIKVLDEAFRDGIEVGTFLQLVGESGVGKSHLMFELIANVSKHKEVAFFSFEMGKRRTDDRMYKKVRDEKQLTNWKIDFFSRNITDLVNEIKLFARDGIKFFVIDSMMKIETDESKDLVAHQRVISHELSKVSQERDIIVCLINQMNKSDIKDGRMDIKGAGDQEYDSDILLFYRKDAEGKRQLVCKKNRQDEILFVLNVKLDNDGNTVDENEIVPHYQQIKETVVEHVSMPKVG